MNESLNATCISTGQAIMIMCNFTFLKFDNIIHKQYMCMKPGIIEYKSKWPNSTLISINVMFLEFAIFKDYFKNCCKLAY